MKHLLLAILFLCAGIPLLAGGKSVLFIRQSPAANRSFIQDTAIGCYSGHPSHCYYQQRVIGGYMMGYGIAGVTVGTTFALLGPNLMQQELRKPFGRNESYLESGKKLAYSSAPIIAISAVVMGVGIHQFMKSNEGKANQGNYETRKLKRTRRLSTMMHVIGNLGLGVAAINWSIYYTTRPEYRQGQVLAAAIVTSALATGTIYIGHYMGRKYCRSYCTPKSL